MAAGIKRDQRSRKKAQATNEKYQAGKRRLLKYATARLGFSGRSFQKLKKQGVSSLLRIQLQKLLRQ